MGGGEPAVDEKMTPEYAGNPKSLGGASPFFLPDPSQKTFPVLEIECLDNSISR